MSIVEILKAVLLGIVEGITEWLPISSTGHMILVEEWFPLQVTQEFNEMFLVVIQLGAILAVCLLFFAFSTILSWHFFGEVNVKYLFGKKAVKVYSLIVVVFIIVGSTLKVDLVWELADFFNGLMVIPNALALIALSRVVAEICRKYSGKKR